MAAPEKMMITLGDFDIRLDACPNLAYSVVDFKHFCNDSTALERDFSVTDNGKNWSLQQKITLVVILALSVSLMAVRLNETPVGAITDDAYYVEMSRSIAEGLGPVVQTGPDAPAGNPSIFPSGFPWLLSFFARVFPESFSALKTVPLLSTLLLLPLCLLLPDKKPNLAIAAVVMLNPWVIAWSGRLLSDNSYAVFSLGALLLYLFLQKTHSGYNPRFILLVLLCALAISVRTIGWTVVLAIIVDLLFRRRLVQAVLFPLAVFVASIPSWLPAVGGSAPLTDAYVKQVFSPQVSSYIYLISHNFFGYIAELPVILLPVFGSPLESILVRLGIGAAYPVLTFVTGFSFLFLIVLAVYRNWKDQNHSSMIRLFAFYLLIYGAVLVNFDGYPSGVQTRLLIPVLPLLAYLVFIGLKIIFSQKLHSGPALVLGIMILAALMHNGWRVAHPLSTSVASDGSGFVDPGVGADWILGNSQPDQVILVQEPLQRHIHFHRPVVSFPSAIETRALESKVRKYEVDFLFIGPSVHGRPNELDENGLSMLAMVQSHPVQYEPVYSNTEKAVYIFLCREDD